MQEQDERPPEDNFDDLMDELPDLSKKTSRKEQVRKNRKGGSNLAKKLRKNSLDLTRMGFNMTGI